MLNNAIVRRMDRAAWTAAALLALAGTALAQEGAPAKPAQQPAAETPAGPVPNIEFGKLQHDFGSIYDTTPVTVEFEFRNTGDATLVLNGKPQASCGCTVPALTKTEYAPGESGTIAVTFNPHGKNGEQTQRVTVRSNDPDAAEVQLQIQAFVKSMVRVEPTTTYFMEKLDGKAETMIVTITGETPDFAATYASVMHPEIFSIKVLDTQPIQNERGETYQQTRLEVTMAADAPRGRHTSTATVRTNDERVPLVSFTVAGDVVGDLRVMPPRVNLGINEPGQSFERLVRVTSRSNTPFTITDVEVTSNLPHQPEVHITPLNPDQPTPQSSYELRISGTGADQTGPISGIIKLSTDSPSMPLIELLFNGVTRAPLPTPPQPGPGATPPQPTGPQRPALNPAPAQPQPAAKPGEHDHDHNHDH